MSQVAFDEKPLFKTSKPIRLIELFSGIGAQAKALENLGVHFENHRTSEWEYHAILSYDAIHTKVPVPNATSEMTKDRMSKFLLNFGISSDGKKPMTEAQIKRLPEQKQRDIINAIFNTHNVGSIVNLKANDLGITNTDVYTYLLTYSFPCQDLSVAGKMKGMSKGDNTRSGMLWEVERLLKECDELPQILLMENVTNVHGKKNIKDFEEWIAFLTSLGYSNYWQDLNSKEYTGVIPQNRNRCFMVSILGDYGYMFPKKIPLEKRLKDVLETEVDEKYYLSMSMVEYFEEHSKECEKTGKGFRFNPHTNGGGRCQNNHNKSWRKNG